MNQWGNAKGGLAFDPARRARDTELVELFLRRQPPFRPLKHHPQLRFVPGLIAPQLLGQRVVRE